MRPFLAFLVSLVGLSAQGATVTVSNVTDLVTAITNNNNSGSGGGVVVVNAGTYNLSSSVHASNDPNIGIDIAKPITIQAASGASPTINFSSGYIALRIQYSNTIIDGLTFAGAQFGVQVQDVSNFNNYTVSNIILRRLSVSTTGTGGQAISTGGMLDSIIEYCSVTSTYNAGIVLDRGPSPTLSGSNRNLVVNNSVSNTGSGSGIAVKLSDYNTIAGNSVTDTAFDGIFVNGGLHNYIGQNTILRPHNGITLTKETVAGRQSLRNYVGNNSLALNGKAGSDALWFDYDSNYNMGFLNEGYGAQEAGMALFNSVGNYVRANNLHDNPNGGIVVRTDPASGSTVPTHNSIQQNYFHDHPANGGITTSTETQNDYGFNYISGNPSQIGSPIAGILTAGSTNSVFYSNVIRDLRQAEQIQTSSNLGFYLNRHVNTVNHYVFTDSSAIQFDSGSTTLGGNYFSDFTSPNGNPSNGATPYTNIIDQNGMSGVYRDNYPYASENLGKVYSIGLRLPSAGSTFAVGTSKTIAWASQGCMLVDIYLLNSNGSVNTTIASNTPDYGYYRWLVPSLTSTSYLMRVDCKTSAGNATGKTSVGPAFTINPAGLTLLSPQANLITDSGSKMQISWYKLSSIPAVDVYIRYSDSQAYSLVQAGVAADFLTINTPVVSTNRASVKLVYGGFGDSTDGWFSIRGSSAGAFTSPASADNLYVGTPYLVEWTSPQTTDFVSLDLIGSGTRNIVTQLGDFGSYQMLVPDLQGAGTTLRLTFYNSAGSILQQISSPGQTVLNSASQPNAISAIAGSGQSAGVNTAFAAALQVQVTNLAGSGISGVAVTFSAPTSGASGTFGGSTTVLTNGAGVAAAPPFTANGTAGTYLVTATAGTLSTTFSLTNTAGTSTQSKIGFFFNSSFALDANGNGHFDGAPGDKYFFYVSQQAGDIAVVGDWNGDGRSKAGIYRNGFWILDYNGNGVYDNDGTAPNDKFYSMGGPAAQYIPVVGDWSGNGKTKIGYYHGGFWALDYNGSGAFDSGDRSFALGGNANEVPLVGDWNHDGRAKAGVFYTGTFLLDYDGSGSYNAGDKIYPFLTYSAGDKPVVGDWSGNGFTKVGIYRNGFWILDYNGNGSYDGAADRFFAFGGNSSEIPIVGDWNGTGTTKIGYYLNGFWALDYNGNGSFDGVGAGQDKFYAFGGNSGEQPLIGKW